MTRPGRTVLLRLAADADTPADCLRGQLSAVVQVQGELWLASDESNSVERLTRTGPGEYGRHRMFRLADVLAPPGGDEAEIDIEGLAADDGYLWMDALRWGELLIVYDSPAARRKHGARTVQADVFPLR